VSIYAVGKRRRDAAYHDTDVNEVLLKLREDGTYDDIYRKWFGGQS